MAAAGNGGLPGGGGGFKDHSSRRLGNNELFCNLCHSHGNLNVMCGLTLLTRHAVDEGLMKCALQEFQHMYPQLTSRLRPTTPTAATTHGADQTTSSTQLSFVPMECPTFPLDSEFQCRDMLHTKFDVDQGPLWRVQLVTEQTMDKAALGFGPEVEAIVEDDSVSVETRWHNFLRYFQGKVNQSDIEDFDEEEEGFRSFILMTFHPSVTDIIGSFHLLRQFLFTLDAILEQDGNATSGQPPPEELHLPVEALLPQGESGGFHFGDLLPMAKMVGNFMMPRKSPINELRLRESGHADADSLSIGSDRGSEADGQPAAFKTEILRGWLTVQQTSELLAMMEEDDASLHGVLLAAGLTAVSRVLQSENETSSSEYPPSRTLHLRATNETNLRQYCPSAPRHGCLSTYHESDHVVQPITERHEFWRLAHDLTVRHNALKGSREPLKMLRLYGKMFSYGSGEGAFKDMEKQTSVRNELGVSAYGDLGSLFRRESPAHQSLDTWNRPLNVTQRNIRLEDVFHATAAQNMGSPMTHTAHLLHGRLNYILAYYTSYLDQRRAFMVRDETVNILRMATEMAS